MRLHLVDGTFELFRAHFSKRPEKRDSSGQNVKATLGVVDSLLALLRDPSEQVTHIAVAFDNPIRSFRNDLFEGYKSDADVPGELLGQLNTVEDAVRALGIAVWSMSEWEADDALATAADRWAEEVEQVRILTPDKDLGQCIQGDRVVMVDRVRKRVIDETALQELRGIAPDSVPDYLALVGDDADGIPGIDGFGEKTAAALLDVYSRIENIPRRGEDWAVRVARAPALGRALSGNLDRALLYRRLATLVRSVPLPQTLDELRWRGTPCASFGSWCDRTGASARMREEGLALGEARRNRHADVG